MNNKSKIEEVTIEAPAKDIKTLKSTNAIDKNDTVKVTDKSMTQSTQPTTAVQGSSVTEELAPITPQDPETIKYLSNVKDSKTGEISKPFSIGDKKYQMIRGIKPSKEVVMAVFCHNDMDGEGKNIIHPMEYFEEHIAKKAIKEAGYDYADAERDFHDKENLKLDEPAPVAKPAVASTPKVEPKKENTNNSLKLGEYKHFCVDKKSGKVRKFKRVEELAKANMTEDESYMNLSQFKKHVDEALFGSRQKPKEIVEADGTNAPENSAVKKASDEMLIKVKPYLTKLVEPMEKVQFIIKLVGMIQVPANKYSTLITALKKAGDALIGADAHSPSTSANPSTSSSVPSTSSNPSTLSTSPTTTEGKVITKKTLEENLKKEKVIKTIKVKDIK